MTEKKKNTKLTVNKQGKGDSTHVCKAPLARLETFERYLNKQGGISYKAQFAPWAEVEQNLQYYKAKYRRVHQVGCGTCTECRLNKSRDKANQMLLEKRLYPEDNTWFITLTYNDENLPTHTTVDIETGEAHEGISLCKADAQKFIKRLRIHYERKHGHKNIRYVLCGEYGGETHRPHYHAIIYNLPLDQTKLKLYTHNEQGQSIWTHETLSQIWAKGFVTVGRVTWDSCAYVARYVMKKQYGENTWYYGAQGCIPEFILQSLKPAIGREYLINHQSEILRTDTIPIANKKTTQYVKPPKSFDNYLSKVEPKKFHSNQVKRQIRAETAERATQKNSDLLPAERRIRHNEALEEKIKVLSRKEI